jgi:hypothetical protein
MNPIQNFIYLVNVYKPNLWTQLRNQTWYNIAKELQDLIGWEIQKTLDPFQDMIENQLQNTVPDTPK